jgi:tetratricopeptide (TPR) repeat protein
MAQLTIQQAFDLALQHHRAGHLQEAEKLYRQILVHQPNHAEATHLLGMIAHQVGQKDIAENLIRQAIAIRPDNFGAYINLGIILAGKGELDAAIVAYRQAIAVNPNLPEGHSNLGIALNIKGQVDEAIAAHRRAIGLRPGYSEARNLGFALKDKGDLDEAVTAYRQAVACRPDYAEAHSDLGNALRESGRLDEAIAAYGRAVALNPSLPEAHYHLATALLAKGDFELGWREYEWRQKCKELSSQARNFTQPRWDGCSFEGRTLLIHAEQGFGDAIQFFRYLPLVVQRGGKIIVECHPELERIFQAAAGSCQVVARGQPPPNFDLHCSLLSLPQVFGATLADIPKDVPYLQPDAEETRRWQGRLADHSTVMKVGLVWAGSSGHKNDRNRSIELARLAPLMQTPGVGFFSLQKGNVDTGAKTSPAGMELIDWTRDLKDFADTAALIANLDLVIAVDTAVAHLAGAMGKPVWTLLPFVPDWRWLLEREDSPWYPTMRLFRQPLRGDWDSVIRRVADELRLLGRGR